MITSLVVSLDLEETGDRAMPTAASLATLGGLPVELITVSSPGMPAAPDIYELERRAAAHRLEQFSCVVLRDEAAGGAIVEHMASRPDALLVMGTSAKGPVARQLLGSVSEYVLGHIGSPVLMVGPHTLPYDMSTPTLIVCVDDSDHVDVAAPVIASWLDTFGGRTVITTVESGEGDIANAGATERLWQLGRVVAARSDTPAATVVLSGRDTATALDKLAERTIGAVLLAVSVRWTDNQFHRHSVTRDLVRRATTPVLVVPATALRPGAG